MPRKRDWLLIAIGFLLLAVSATIRLVFTQMGVALMEQQGGAFVASVIALCCILAGAVLFLVALLGGWAEWRRRRRSRQS